MPDETISTEQLAEDLTLVADDMPTKQHELLVNEGGIRLNDLRNAAAALIDELEDNSDVDVAALENAERVKNLL